MFKKKMILFVKYFGKEFISYVLLESFTPLFYRFFKFSF